MQGHGTRDYWKLKKVLSLEKKHQKTVIITLKKMSQYNFWQK